MHHRDHQGVRAAPGVGTTPLLHLVTDPRLPRAQLLAVISAAAENGADWIQVRDHQASARELFDLVQAVVTLCRPRGVRVAVNDRIDVALAVGADGVQLGGRSLPAAVARELVGDLSIGVSVHSVESAVQVEAEGADWITFGHVFPTSSHPDTTPRGITALAQAVQAVHIPVIAIGGIDTRQVGPVIQAGAAGIAVMSAILDAPDPARATAELCQAIQYAVCGRQRWLPGDHSVY
jgi:thiamine-phosphate diphosphorylase